MRSKCFEPVQKQRVRVWMLQNLLNPPISLLLPVPKWGWSGGAMLLGKLPVPGRPTSLIQ